MRLRRAVQENRESSALTPAELSFHRHTEAGGKLLASMTMLWSVHSSTINRTTSLNHDDVLGHSGQSSVGGSTTVTCIRLFPGLHLPLQASFLQE